MSLRSGSALPLVCFALLLAVLATPVSAAVTLQQSIDMSIAAIVLASVALFALVVVLVLRLRQKKQQHQHTHEDAVSMRPVVMDRPNSYASRL